MQCGFMHLLRVSGWVAVIIAAPAVLIIGVAAAHRASAPPRSARVGGTAPAMHWHPTVAGTNVAGQGLRTGTDVAIDPAYFSPGACVAFALVAGNRHLTVFLDEGHGGLDPGAGGITSSGKVIDEADQTLPMVLDTTAIPRRAGFRVVVSWTGPTTVLRLGSGYLSGYLLTVTGAHDDMAARDVCADMAHADVLVGALFITDPFKGSIAASSRGQQIIAAGLARHRTVLRLAAAP